MGVIKAAMFHFIKEVWMSFIRRTELYSPFLIKIIHKGHRIIIIPVKFDFGWRQPSPDSMIHPHPIRTNKTFANFVKITTKLILRLLHKLLQRHIIINILHITYYKITS